MTVLQFGALESAREQTTLPSARYPNSRPDSAIATYSYYLPLATCDLRTRYNLLLTSLVRIEQAHASINIVATIIAIV